ncbi:MAG: radical SAM protein [Melioribacteraceae bacterium]|nr:radical SAM protein [Melioribacteraceae bacterium]
MKTIQSILNNDHLSIEDISQLLQISKGEEAELLFKKSAAVKQLFLGRLKNKILSIRFSNYCELNCLYCELREESDSVKRFRLSPDEVLEKIKSIFSTGITNIILQSGSDSYYDTDMISYLIYKIKQAYDVEITLDLLQRGFNEYRAWKFSGADNYLLKYNTSNSDNFSLFTIKNNLDERINHLKYLKRIGYKICTGNIVGLPHQTIEDIASDLKLLEQLQPEMILNTPFTPQQLTKYQNTPRGDFQLLLKATAISRLLLKKSQIIVAGSYTLFSLEEKKRLFEIGADTLILEPLINGELRRFSSDQ